MTLPAVCSPAIPTRTPPDMPIFGTSIRSPSNRKGRTPSCQRVRSSPAGNPRSHRPKDRHLSEQLERLLTGPAPSRDAAIPILPSTQITSLAGPLFAGVTPRTAKSGTNNWGLDPKLFGKHPDGTAIDAASLCVRAPSVIAVRLPADLVANSQFVTTGSLVSNEYRRRQRAVGSS